MKEFGAQRIGLLCLALALCACGKPATLPNSFTFRGHISFSDLGATFPPGSFGGDVQIAGFVANSEGYCLPVPNAVAAVAFDVVSEPDLATLQTGGYDYELTLLDVPGKTYPFTLYPVAVWQDTVVEGHACEIDASGTARYNAIGYYGLTTDDYGAGPTSPCCAFSPHGVVVPAVGAVLDGIDFVMVPAAFSPVQCVAANAAADICSDRHPFGSTIGDSACFTALGSAAAGIFVQRDDNGAAIGACP